MVLRFSRHDLYRDLFGSFRREPPGVIVALYDPHSEQGMSLLDLGHSVDEHIFGYSPLDPGDHGHDGKRG
jgi:hypothetical protein